MAKALYTSVNDYINQIEESKLQAFQSLRAVIFKNLPKGFEEEIAYNMPAYVVPLRKYPKGYHCAKNQALPFISIAAQKNFIALYHMGLYADNTLYDWFVNEYPKHNTAKLDIGKSCIRFKKPEHIPLDLIAELAKKMTTDEWIGIYEEKYLPK